MREYLFEVLEGGGDLSMQTVFIRLVMAVVIAAFIYLSYRLSHNGSIYSQKFNVSLAVMTIVTATVMIVIGNNIALSLGMVGALSIVRFRTAIKDSRDTVYIFGPSSWASAAAPGIMPWARWEVLLSSWFCWCWGVCARTTACS